VAGAEGAGQGAMRRSQRKDGGQGFVGCGEDFGFSACCRIQITESRARKSLWLEA
jgi:hypothetical protein